MNVLDLNFVRDPDSAVAAALRIQDPGCEDTLSHFYTAWTVIWPTPEREKAAAGLLDSMDRHGLGHMKDRVRERAEEVRKEWGEVRKELGKIKCRT